MAGGSDQDLIEVKQRLALIEARLEQLFTHLQVQPLKRPMGSSGEGEGWWGGSGEGGGDRRRRARRCSSSSGQATRSRPSRPTTRRPVSASRSPRTRSTPLFASPKPSARVASPDRPCDRHIPGRARSDRERAHPPHQGGPARRRAGRPLRLGVRPGAGDRGRRLQHDRPARRDDDPRLPDPADRGLRLHRDQGRAALEGAPALRRPQPRGYDRAALRIPRQPDDDPARRAGDLPAGRRAGHRPDPADHHRGDLLEHRGHGDPDRRPAEHHHRRSLRPQLQRLHRQPRADRGADVRRRHRIPLFRLQTAASGGGKEPALRDGPRRRGVDHGRRRAAADGPRADRDDPALLRPPGAAHRAGDGRARRAPPSRCSSRRSTSTRRSRRSSGRPCSSSSPCS